LQAKDCDCRIGPQAAPTISAERTRAKAPLPAGRRLQPRRFRMNNPSKSTTPRCAMARRARGSVSPSRTNSSSQKTGPVRRRHSRRFSGSIPAHHFFPGGEKAPAEHARPRRVWLDPSRRDKSGQKTPASHALESGMPVTTIVGKNLDVARHRRSSARRSRKPGDDRDPRVTLSRRGREVTTTPSFLRAISRPGYALKTLARRCVVARQSFPVRYNGGTLVDEFKEIVGHAVKEFGADKIGRALPQRQRSRRGLIARGSRRGWRRCARHHERLRRAVGNANMTTVLPTLF